MAVTIDEMPNLNVWIDVVGGRYLGNRMEYLGTITEPDSCFYLSSVTRS